MVDDRLMTGCLAACEAGARPIWIRQPYIRWLGKQGGLELYFWLLRWLDRLLIV
jgi:uncharacterized protein